MTCKDRERTEAHEEMDTMRRMKGEWERERERGREGRGGDGGVKREGGRGVGVKREY